MIDIDVVFTFNSRLMVIFLETYNLRLPSGNKSHSHKVRSQWQVCTPQIVVDQLKGKATDRIWNKTVILKILFLPFFFKQYSFYAFRDPSPYPFVQESVLANSFFFSFSLPLLSLSLSLFHLFISPTSIQLNFYNVIFTLF